VHYLTTVDASKFFIQTSNTSEKVKPVLDGAVKVAPLVIGFSEIEWLTLQLRGPVRLVSKEELSLVHEIHYKKHPGAEKCKDDPETVFAEFTPSWWRFTDLTTDPETIIEM